MRWKIPVWGLVLGSLIITAPFSRAGATTAPGGIQTGKEAPPFSIPTVGGGRFDLKETLNGNRIVLINFWGLRCGACIQEMPALTGLHRKYAGRLRIIGINVDGVDAAFLKDQMGKSPLGMEYEVSPDPDFTVVDLYRMPAAPYTVLVDPKGVVRYVHEGYKPGDEGEIDTLIRNILDQGTR